MKKIFGFTLFCLFANSVLSQSRLELYNSAVKSSLFQTLDENQKAQVNAQLSKNEKLDPAINYYYLKSNFPSNLTFKEKYNSLRIETALIHNNYLKSLESSLRNEYYNPIFFEQLISKNIQQLIVSDLSQDNIHTNDQALNHTDENIQFYFRVLLIKSENKSFFNDSLNYKEIFTHEILNFIEETESSGDSISSSLEFNTEEKVNKIIRLLSILNVIGDNTNLKILEVTAKNFLSRLNKNYSDIDLNQVQKGKIVQGSFFTLFKFQFGHKTYFFGNIRSRSYGVHNTNSSIQYKIDQSINYNNFLFFNLCFYPFLYVNTNNIFQGLYFNYSTEIINPVFENSISEKINDDDITLSITNKAGETYLRTLELKKAKTKINFFSINSFGVNLPVYNWNELIFFELGTSIDLHIISEDMNYTSTAHLTGNNLNSDFELVSGKIKNNIFINTIINPKINLSSRSFYGFKFESMIGLNSSSFQLYWNW